MSDVEKIGSAGIPLNIVDANGRKIMGDAYDNTAVYAVGDYCISGNHAYKCTTEIETPEDFNTNHWQQITIEEILKEHDASIELVNSSLAQLGVSTFAKWTAQSASAMNTALTENLTLPKGKYILTINTAIPSAGYAVGLNVESGSVDETISAFNLFTGLRTNLTTAISVTSASATICLKSLASASVTFSGIDQYITRLVATRVG